MACKLKPCVVHEYVLAPIPDPLAAPVPPPPPQRAVTVRRDVPIPGPVIDSSKDNPRDALIEQLDKQMRSAQEEECGEGCVCVKQEGAPGTAATFQVPLSARYRDKPNSFRLAEGTVRITVTDYPGKCFEDPGWLVAGVPPEDSVSLATVFVAQLETNELLRKLVLRLAPETELPTA